MVQAVGGGRGQGDEPDALRQALLLLLLLLQLLLLLVQVAEQLRLGLGGQLAEQGVLGELQLQGQGLHGHRLGTQQEIQLKGVDQWSTPKNTLTEP